MKGKPGIGFVRVAVVAGAVATGGVVPDPAGAGGDEPASEHDVRPADAADKGQVRTEGWGDRRARFKVFSSYPDRANGSICEEAVRILAPHADALRRDCVRPEGTSKPGLVLRSMDFTKARDLLEQAGFGFLDWQPMEALDPENEEILRNAIYPTEIHEWSRRTDDSTVKWAQDREDRIAETVALDRAGPVTVNGIDFEAFRWASNVETCTPATRWTRHYSIGFSEDGRWEGNTLNFRWDQSSNEALVHDGDLHVVDMKFGDIAFDLILSDDDLPRFTTVRYHHYCSVRILPLEEEN